jgi:hypothetical protein
MRPGGWPPGHPLRSRAPQTPWWFMLREQQPAPGVGEKSPGCGRRWSKRSRLLRQLDDLSGSRRSICSWTSRNSLINSSCSTFRPRNRSTLVMPMLCWASCWRRRRLASEGKCFARTALRAERPAVAISFGVGNVSRKARATSRLGS